MMGSHMADSCSIAAVNRRWHKKRHPANIASMHQKCPLYTWTHPSPQIGEDAMHDIKIYLFVAF